MDELRQLEQQIQDIQGFDMENLTNYQFDPLEYQTSSFQSFQVSSHSESKLTKIKEAQSESLFAQDDCRNSKKLSASEKSEPLSAEKIHGSFSQGSTKQSLFSSKKSVKKKPTKLTRMLTTQLCTKAEDLFKAKKPLHEVRKSLSISQRLALKLKGQYAQKGKILPSHSRQKCQKLNPQREKQYAQVQQTLKSLITKNCSITLKQMQMALRQKGIKRSKSTIHGYLQKMKYSRKKLQKIPLQRNSNNNIVYRQNYCKMIQQIPLQKQVFLDETIFGLQTTGHYGWAPRGEQPKVLIPASRKKHITLLAAISINGFQATQIIKGPVTSRHICQFLEHYLDHLQPDEVVILDNARMHHAAIVKSKIKELDRNIRYIPAYTPQLNPIQNVFSEIKAQYIKLKADKELKNEEMIQLVEQSVKTMRSKQFSRYYEHYQKWLKLGISGQLFN